MKKKQEPNRLVSFLKQVFTKTELIGIFIFFISIPCFFVAYDYWEEYETIDFNHLININDFTYSNKVQPNDKRKLLTLRVVAPIGERVFSRLSPYGPGFERELLESFAAKNQVNIIYTHANSRSEALELLKEDEVDVVVGFHGELSSEDSEALSAGSIYTSSSSGKIVNTKLTKNSSSWYKAVSDPLSSLMKQVEKSLTLNFNTHLEANLADGPFIEEDSGLVDEHSLKLWQPFMPNLKVAFKEGTQSHYRWIWRHDNVIFFPMLYGFWDDQSTSELIKALEEKYFGFLPSGSPPWKSLQDLAKIVDGNLPEYKSTLSAASNKHKINPLLLISLIYKESRFDAEAQSPTGPLGLMQFTQATAQHLNVDPLDPVKSIDAGARYLKMMWDDLDKLNLDFWDRWFFTLAAYNQGPAHLQDAIRLSKQMGGTGKTWRELKTIYPLLAQEKYYSQAQYGACRGNEAVDFVETIRYYLYVLNGISSISRLERQNLALRASD